MRDSDPSHPTNPNDAEKSAVLQSTPRSNRRGAFQPMLATLIFGTALSGCAQYHETQPQDGTDGPVTIYYRGRSVTAQRQSGRLFVEGDILVAPSDLWGPSGSVTVLDGGSGAREQVVGTGEELKIQGFRYWWPVDSSGSVTVPYQWAGPTEDLNNDGRIDAADDFSAADRTSIVQAMTDWSTAVTTLRFRLAVAGDSDILSFKMASPSSPSCSSAVGRIGGTQSILLGSGCIGPGNFRVHHEIGHALGLYHQHTRTDRNSFVSVTWANIKGCLPDAGVGGNAVPGACTPAIANCSSHPALCGCTAADVTAGYCDFAFNFAVDNARSNIGAYDYGSVMHYGAYDFGKTILPDGGATGTMQVIYPGPGNLIGQRSRLSDGDVYAMRAMYPEVVLHKVFFRDTGAYRLCRLDGREDDVAVSFSATAGTIPAANLSGGSVVTTALAEGDYTVNGCAAKSVFWNENYSYPNTSRTFDLTTYAPANIETYTGGNPTTIRVLNPGLLGTLFAG